MRFGLPSLLQLLASCILAACNSTPQLPAGLSDQDQAALRSFAVGDSGLVTSRNWDALAAGYSIDAVRMPPNQPPVEGRDAIRRWLEQLPPITSFNFRLVDLQGAGAVAFMRGSYSITAAPPGVAPVSDSGKILVVFRKQLDGSWLRVADAWNSVLPPAK